jgi:hypothetical protein
MGIFVTGLYTLFIALLLFLTVVAPVFRKVYMSYHDKDRFYVNDNYGLAMLAAELGVIIWMFIGVFIAILVVFSAIAALGWFVEWLTVTLVVA